MQTVLFTVKFLSIALLAIGFIGMLRISHEYGMKKGRSYGYHVERQLSFLSGVIGVLLLIIYGLLVVVI